MIGRFTSALIYELIYIAKVAGFNQNMIKGDLGERFTFTILGCNYGHGVQTMCIKTPKNLNFHHFLKLPKTQNPSEINLKGFLPWEIRVRTLTSF